MDDHSLPIPLVAIHDPADRERRILIREGEFDPAQHRAWGAEQTAPPAPVVVIPDNWQELSWPQLKSLASKFGHAGNSDEAKTTIEAELAKRADEAKAQS